jgi:L-ascorbate metabolism protein UlaG (beta-lactamase superfamily)
MGRINCAILLLIFIFSMLSLETIYANAVSDSLLFIGHASVKIKTQDGKIIYIDPYQPGNYKDSADVVLITHAHSDHNNLSLVKQKSGCTVITYANANINGIYKNFLVGNIKISAVAAYNQNHSKSQCVGYVISVNGIKIYHAGDTGKIPEMSALADSNITYALLPVDGIYTMTPEEGTEAAAMINAEFSIPIHTEPPPDNFNENIAARFTPVNKLIIKHGETIALNNVTSAKNSISNISKFKLYPNYPNPFNPSTNIVFDVPKTLRVTLTIYNLIGERVRLLADNIFNAGNHSVSWNSMDDNGLQSPSGIYFVRFEADNVVYIQKIMLLR